MVSVASPVTSTVPVLVVTHVDPMVSEPQTAAPTRPRRQKRSSQRGSLLYDFLAEEEQSVTLVDQIQDNSHPNLDIATLNSKTSDVKRRTSMSSVSTSRSSINDMAEVDSAEEEDDKDKDASEEEASGNVIRRQSSSGAGKELANVLARRRRMSDGIPNKNDISTKTGSNKEKSNGLPPPPPPQKIKKKKKTQGKSPPPPPPSTAKRVL